MPKLWHYTLNSSDTADCSRKRFDPQSLALLRPLARRAILEEHTEAPLPSPLQEFSVKITAIDGAALFDIFQGQGIVNINAVAWTQAGAEECWEGFESLYLRLSKRFGILLGRAPQMPDHLPWLATLVLPNPVAPRLAWLADFEQCLALALIREGQQKRDKARGFGRD